MLWAFSSSVGAIQATIPVHMVVNDDWKAVSEVERGCAWWYSSYAIDDHTSGFLCWNRLSQVVKTASTLICIKSLLVGVFKDILSCHPSCYLIWALQTPTFCSSLFRLYKWTAWTLLYQVWDMISCSFIPLWNKCVGLVTLSEWFVLKAAIPPSFPNRPTSGPLRTG